MKTIAKSKYLEFKSAVSPSGSDWYYVARTNDSLNHDSAVVITTIVKQNNEYNFLFLKTSRPPLTAENKAKYCLESPAGLIGDNDSNEKLIECAKKELLQEAGLKTEHIYLELTNSCTSSGLSSETLSYVTAITDDYNIVLPPVSDGGIILDRLLVPVKNINEFLRSLPKNKYSIASATITGVFFALSRI